MSRKPFAVFDIDGTLFRWQLFHELIFELVKLGALPLEIEHEIAQPLAKWQIRTHEDSFREYEKALITVFSRHLAGLSVEKFHTAIGRVMERSSDKVYRYTRGLLASLKKDGYMLFAVSGSFEEIVAPFSQKYGFDAWVGSRCEQKHGVFTGTSRWAYDKKGALLQQLVAEHGLDWEGSIGVGDTGGDIPMLQLVKQPIAFNPNQELFKHANDHGWRIVVERKNMIYQLEKQGNSYRLAS